MSKLEVEVTGDGLRGKTAAKDIPVGTVFFGSINDIPRVFLRIYDGLVDLQCPSSTWNFTGFGGPKITDYRPADTAKLVVG